VFGSGGPHTREYSPCGLREKKMNGQRARAIFGRASEMNMAIGVSARTERRTRVRVPSLPSSRSTAATVRRSISSVALSCSQSWARSSSFIRFPMCSITPITYPRRRPRMELQGIEDGLIGPLHLWRACRQGLFSGLPSRVGHLSADQASVGAVTAKGPVGW
jgi:hypothetical protein